MVGYFLLLLIGYGQLLWIGYLDMDLGRFPTRFTPPITMLPLNLIPLTLGSYLIPYRVLTFDLGA